MIYDKTKLNDEQIDKLITDNYKMDFLGTNVTQHRHSEKKSSHMNTTFNSNSRMKSF